MIEPSLFPPMTPQTPLQNGETVIASFTPDRTVYIRDHVVMAALSTGLAMAALWIAGNAHIWTGAAAGITAIAARGWYMASEELSVRWDLTNQRVLGPQQRKADLNRITMVRSFASVVQIVTGTGDKHLIKYQTDPAATIAAIRQAQG